jgi:hypothetical protein
MDSYEDPIEVIGPSGAKFQVLNEQEKDYFEDVAQRYLKDNKFTNVTDLQDLDRILTMELMCYRWQQWLTLEVDYFGGSINPEDTRKSIKEYSTEIRLLKKSLGIDKGSRDKDKGESVAAYLEDLRVRAAEFGIMRNDQAAKAITLAQEMIALLTWHDNCTEDERRENDIEAHDLIDWIRSIFMPEFQEIDAKFRETSQKYWIREM